MPDKKKLKEEITLKFGKGLAEDFKGKDGKDYKRILIPNRDPDDHSPWASFVLPAKNVHENKYGKGLWAKIPADGQTLVTKPERITNGDGENIWNDRKMSVSNQKLKEMVEAYKTKGSHARESTKDKLDSLVKETAAQLSSREKRQKPVSRGPEH
jgi:hypothetical protein